MFRLTMGCPASKFSARKSLRLLSLLLSLFWLQDADHPNTQARSRRPPPAQSPPQQQNIGADSAQEVATLELGQPIERELAGGQKHSYRIALAEGQYAGLIVEQRGIDITIRLQGSEGQTVANYDNECGSQGEEKVELVAAVTGSYQLSVQALSRGAPSGQYRIHVAETRAATEQDRLMYDARRLEEASRQAFTAARYEDARQFAERALSISESVLGTEHPFVARLLLRLAAYHHSKTNYAEAARLFERALAISEKSFGAEHPQTIDNLRGLGALYFVTNELDKAERLLDRAGELSQKALGAEHPLTAKSLRDLARVTKEPKRKEELLQRALQIAEKTLGPEDELVGDVLNDLGNFYLHSRDYQQSEQFLLRAQATYQKTLGADHLSFISNLHNFGYLAQRTRKHAKAEEYYLKAIALAEKMLGPDNPRVAPTLNNLANIYSVRGEGEKSVAALLRVLHITETTHGPYHSLAMIALGNLALRYAEQGNIAETIKYQTRVDTTIERFAELNLAIGSERDKLTYLETLPRRTNRTISLAVHHAPHDAAARALAALVLLQRKGRLLDAMSDSFARLRQLSTAEEGALLDQYNDTVTQLAHLALNGPRTMTVAEHRKKVGELEALKGRLEADISRRSAEFRAQSQRVTLEAVQAAIPANAALVEIVVYRPHNPQSTTFSGVSQDPHYAACVLRRTGEARWLDLGDAKALNGAIDSLRRALRDPLSRDARELSRAIDEKVMRPLRALTGDAKHLLISPDGELNLIPFEALVDEGGRYLLERYSFTYLTSGRDLLRMAVARESRSNPAVIANPWFGEPAPGQIASAGVEPMASGDRRRRSVTAARSLSELYFGPLNGTAQEARTIGALFPEARLLAGTQATESEFKRVAAPRLLHIATHGFFLQDAGSEASADDAPADARSTNANAKNENPLMRSGLALAGANRRGGAGDDGILTALEASALNLWGTKLVVLSACDTGLGEVRNGEGVYGLRRAFVLAGAESLVVSLWPVSDYATRTLMTSYYRNLKQGLGRGAALRQVQLGMLRRNRQLHPFYWANFIQSGEWANLDGKRH